jgi:HupE / UreJ protein
MKRGQTLVIVLALVEMAVATPVAAHTGGTNGYATVRIDRDHVHYSLTMWPAALTPAVASSLQMARTGDIASRDQMLGVVRSKVTVTAQSRRCEPGPGSLAPPTSKDSVILVVNFACGTVVRDLLIRDDLFDVLGPDYHTLARIDAPGQTVQFAFTPETRETRLTLDAANGGRRDTLSFVLLGVQHILSGYDHLLFLFGLLLRGGGWVALAKIITAFTLAHSVTLALAVLDVVVLPDRLVEAVIALSIACVAAENLVARPVVSRRWLVSFCFGLVHGFGFSSALRELGLPTHGLVLSLFGFNAGVELGQGLVVAVALPALALVRNTRWEPRMVWGSSLAILLVGFVLFVERTFL